MMALSKHQKSTKNYPEIQDEEPVLTFHGPRMRKGQCITMVVEDMQVKYLVRYQSGTGVTPGVVTCLPYAQPQKAAPSHAPAKEPQTVSSGSKAKASTSQAGLGTSQPSTSRAGPSTSKESPSTSKAGPSTSKAGPSTSKAGPSPGRAALTTNRFSTRRPAPSSSSQSTSGTSGNHLGGAAAQGASGRKSSSNGAVSQGASGASTSGPQSSVPKVVTEEEFCPTVSGWDYEWIPENRVLRYSTAQLKQDSDTAIQMTSRKEHTHFSGSRSFSYGGDHGDPGEGSSSAMAQPPAKRSREKLRVQGRTSWGSRGDAGDPKQKDSSERSEIHINLPKSLRPLLVQDWELVTLEKKLCNLPAKISVEAILSEYAVFPLNCRTRDKRYAVSGLVAVIKEYFNVILSTQLLYDFERPQYAELVISYPSSQMSQLYGGAHLLRLFQQLGPMLTCTSLDDNSLSVLMNHLQDFLEYLASNPSLLFIEASDYELASDEYLKVAE